MLGALLSKVIPKSLINIAFKHKAQKYQMENLEPLASAAEQTPISTSREDAVGAETPTQLIVIDDSEDDRLARPSTRLQRTNVNRPDYSYSNFMDVMDDAITETSHRRKRKRGLVTRDVEDISSIFVSTLYLFSTSTADSL